MNLINYIQEAEQEALRQHIRANSVMLNRKIALVRQSYAAMNGGVTEYPPMVCGLSAFLTDELPDDIAFVVFESPNPPLTREERIKQEARQEFLDELRTMTFEEIADLIEKG